MPALCRDCLTLFQTGRCPECRSPRVLSHPELLDLTIAHIDCDAFYASVEKRDDPALRDLPVIVGGGRRGVVTTACYIARVRGVRSAMPMFEALRRCPEASIRRPRFEVYAAASRAIRARLEALTPAVEPLSLDEAFLDLGGTRLLHRAAPALLLARLARDIEREEGLGISIGLSHNKFLAKVASDLDKPRGFAVIGRGDTAAFLRDRPVRLLWGVGEATQAALAAAGIRTFADLLRWERNALLHRFGRQGERLWHLARGDDPRRVTPHGMPKSISNETTFEADTDDPVRLDGHLWRMAEKVAGRAKAQRLAGRVVVLKLRRADFSSITRRLALPEATQLADRLYRTARGLYDGIEHRTPYRLLGVGLTGIVPEAAADLEADLLDAMAARRAGAERAADAIRARFGPDAILKGRALR